MENRLPGQALAEFVGVFALTLVGGGAIVLTKSLAMASGADLVAIALAHGLILSVMVTATMHISGGQINPAVSLALVFIKKQTIGRAGVFIVAQLAGGVVAALVLAQLVVPALVDGQAESMVASIDSARIGATLGGLTSFVPVLVLEVIATFFLMFVIMGSAVDGRGVGASKAVGGFAIGLTVAANILFFGPLTGASMNPARSFGPALIGGHWDLHAAYWIGPIVGAALAALAWRSLMGERDEAGGG